MAQDRIDRFKAERKEVEGGFIEPDFDDSYNFQCELIDGVFIVHVFNAPLDKIEKLKLTHEFIETVFVDKPVLGSMPS